MLEHFLIERFIYFQGQSEGHVDICGEKGLKTGSRMDRKVQGWMRMFHS